MKIDKSEWKLKNPKLFEYDSKNKAVDVFVYADTNCPFPFTVTNTEDIWFHQGFWLVEFIALLGDFFERYNLPYKVVKDED